MIELSWLSFGLIVLGVAIAAGFVGMGVGAAVTAWGRAGAPIEPDEVDEWRKH